MDSTVTLGPLAQVSLLCHSAEQTEAWYRDVLRLPHIFTFGDLVFFDMNGTRLYFRQVSDEEFRKGSTLYFSVGDMTTAVTMLQQRGVRFQGAPHMIYKDEETGVEEWFSFFDDPTLPDENGLPAPGTLINAADERNTLGMFGSGAIEMLVALSGYGGIETYAEGLLVLREDFRDPVLRARGAAWKEALSSALEGCFVNVPGSHQGIGLLLATHWQGSLLWWGFDPKQAVEDYVRATLEQFVESLLPAQQA